MSRAALAALLLAPALGLGQGTYDRAEWPQTDFSKRLAALPDSGVHFAFAWLAFNPDSEIVRALP